jgi:glyoxylase-like metal-dependent hydrolase (beta-lactamase superfamily II)
VRSLACYFRPPGEQVDAMFDSLAKLRELDDAVPVYPGHAYHGDYTTIGRERVPQTGPWPSGILQPFSREQFVSMFGTSSGFT